MVQFAGHHCQTNSKVALTQPLPQGEGLCPLLREAQQGFRVACRTPAQPDWHASRGARSEGQR